MIIGRVISSEVTENRETETKVLMLTVEVFAENDAQEVEFFRQPGIDFRPNADATVLIDQISEPWKVAVAADDNIEPSVEEGEIAIYASDGAAKLSQVRCKADGTVEVGLAGLELVAMASKVHSQISNMLQAGAGAGGPGAANFTAAKAAWDLIAIPPLTGVASSNLKAES